MPQIKVIAKKDLHPIFKKGDKLTIIPILYESNTLLVNEVYGIFRDNKLLRIAEKSDLTRKLKYMEIKKIFDALYAPKGSYKDSIIELEDGRQYPSSLVRDYESYFEKVK